MMWWIAGSPPTSLKLKGLFKDGDEEEAEKKRLEAEAEQKRQAADRAKSKEDTWTAKIKDVFDDDDEEKERERQKLAEEAKQNQSFGAQIRNVFSPHHTPAVEKEQTKTGKFLDLLEGKDKEPPKEKGWLHEHVTSALGGGKTAEKTEGSCDLQRASGLRPTFCHRYSGQDDRSLPEACPSGG
jgi:hypothetical protein